MHLSKVFYNLFLPATPYPIYKSERQIYLDVSKLSITFVTSM